MAPTNSAHPTGVVGYLGATTQQLPTAASRPASTVRIAGGTARQRRTLRAILAGFGPTAIRSIDVNRAHTGFVYTVAIAGKGIDDGAANETGLWEASTTGNAYAQIARRQGLPRLAWETYVSLLPDGQKCCEFGGVAGTVSGPLPAPPSHTVLLSRVKAAAARAGFQVDHLGLVHPLVAIPVIVASVRGHAHIEQRVETFLQLLPHTDPDLSYVQVDDACGRPVFAHGGGVGVDLRWFRICDFAAACPPPTPGNSRPLTYPC